MVRPWGLLEWTLGLADPKPWAFLGVLGTEERSLSALKNLRPCCKNHILIQIEDNDSPFFSADSKLCIEKRRMEYAKEGHSVDKIKTYPLFAGLGQIDRIAKEISASNNALILDITSMPKRYFFPILRRLCRDDNVRDLIITYTLPDRYANDGRPLSEGAGAWTHLPGFLPPIPGAKELLIAGAGFPSHNLKTFSDVLVEQEPIQMLIPFPAPLEAVYQAWQSVHRLEGTPNGSGKFRNFRVPANDISSTFDRIVSLTRNDNTQPAFAPFGPKPISAAMCLFAAQKECAAYYPQPTAYHPNYTIGVAKSEGVDAVLSYWVKESGNFLYKIP